MCAHTQAEARDTHTPRTHTYSQEEKFKPANSLSLCLSHKSWAAALFACGTQSLRGGVCRRKHPLPTSRATLSPRGLAHCLFPGFLILGRVGRS